jgi:hypothetical protein
LKTLNSELLLKTYLVGDGFEFSEKDIVEFEKLKDVEFDKQAYPNVYRWCSMVKNIMANGGNAPKATAADKKESIAPKIAPVVFGEHKPYSDKNDCTLAGSELERLEGVLVKHAYLSEKDEPSQEDSRVLAAFEATKYLPNQAKYPQLHGWWLHLASFTPAARAEWKA